MAKAHASRLRHLWHPPQDSLRVQLMRWATVRLGSKEL